MITRAAKPLVAGLLLTEASPTPSPACHRADARLHATSPGPWGPEPLAVAGNAAQRGIPCRSDRPTATEARSRQQRYRRRSAPSRREVRRWTNMTPTLACRRRNTKAQ
jgi:hypothetical protein